MDAVRKVIILGAAGRDFHNFNVFFRDAPGYRVVAFTAAQIPHIANRTYPASVNAAEAANVDATLRAARKLNDTAQVAMMALEEEIDRPQLARGRNVLVIEDGPTVTHGRLPEAGGARAARLLGASLVDPRPYALGSIAAAYAQFPHIGPVLPALGYSREQREDLRLTIARVPCDAVLLGTSANLAQTLRIAQPVARVQVQAKDRSSPSLALMVTSYLEQIRSRAVQS